MSGSSKWRALVKEARQQGWDLDPVAGKGGHQTLVKNGARVTASTSAIRGSGGAINEVRRDLRSHGFVDQQARRVASLRETKRRQARAFKHEVERLCAAGYSLDEVFELAGYRQPRNVTGKWRRGEVSSVSQKRIDLLRSVQLSAAEAEAEIVVTNPMPDLVEPQTAMTLDEAPELSLEYHIQRTLIYGEKFGESLEIVTRKLGPLASKDFRELAGTVRAAIAVFREAAE